MLHWQDNMGSGNKKEVLKIVKLSAFMERDTVRGGQGCIVFNRYLQAMNINYKLPSRSVFCNRRISVLFSFERRFWLQLALQQINQVSQIAILIDTK